MYFLVCIRRAMCRLSFPRYCQIVFQRICTDSYVHPRFFVPRLHHVYYYQNLLQQSRCEMTVLLIYIFLFYNKIKHFMCLETLSFLWNSFYPLFCWGTYYFTEVLIRCNSEYELHICPFSPWLALSFSLWCLLINRGS